MRGKLIAAIVLAAAALAALLYLAGQQTVPVMATEPPTEITVPLTETEPLPPETTAQPLPVPPTEPEDPVRSLLNSMTLEEKVGQIFLARCPESSGAAEAAKYALGGLILFDQDFDGQTRESLRSTISSYQNAVKISLLIAVDEEGGTVCRVSNHPAFRAQRFSSPRELYRTGGMERVLSAEQEKAQLLQSLGINVNMAPVCDLSTKQGAFMYRRSLGQSPEITGEFAAGAIGRMAACNIGAVMKHFPGYGNNSDTHTGIAIDRRSLQELESADLQPFFAGIEAGGGAILVSHTVVEALDPEYPASLSPTVHSYLRLAMDFDGVIITDDLFMDAIRRKYGAGESAVLAVLAGNDLLCSTEYAAQYEAVLSACRSGRIPASTLDAAVEHVLRWKASLNLL